MKTNNKVRGGDYEREICRKLSSWWLGKQVNRDLVFWRTQSSGGRATIRARTGKGTCIAHCGDIYAMDPIGAALTNLITWELKLGSREANLHDIIDAPGEALQDYQQWIKQAEESSRNARTPYWAIVHHKSRRLDVMTMPASLWKFLGCSELTVLGPVLYMTLPDSGKIVAVQFDEFLRGVTPKEIRSLSSNALRVG